MRAVVLNSFDGIDGLELSKVADPFPGSKTHRKGPCFLPSARLTTVIESFARRFTGPIW